MREEELVSLLRRDPEEGMRRVMRTYAGLVLAVVRGKLPHHLFCDADIEDCVAQTFSEFYCDLGKYDPGRGSIRSLLCVIARNNATDKQRQRYKEKENLSIDDENIGMYGDVLSYDGGFDAADDRQLLTTAIAQLGEPDKEIVIRKFYFCENSKAIAEKLGLSVSNVDTRTHRAIAKLRSILGGKQ